jgi:hypothetical protein
MPESDELEGRPPERYIWWGRCKLGNGRVYWVVEELGTEPVLAEGLAASFEEAEAAAKAAFDAIRRPGDLVDRQTNRRHRHSRWARERYRRKCQARRRADARPGTGGRRVEYTYTYYASQWDAYEPVWYAYPILKRTARGVWVSPRRCRVEDLGTEREDWWGDAFDERSAYVLDRDDFEREGRAYSRRKGDFFYAEPKSANEGREVVADSLANRADLDVLGLSWPCTTADVKGAYRRLVLRHHPDVGGTDGEFRRVNEAYERVLGVI